MRAFPLILKFMLTEISRSIGLSGCTGRNGCSRTGSFLELSLRSIAGSSVWMRIPDFSMKYPRLEFGMKLRGFRQQSRYEDISVEELLSVEVVYLVGEYQVTSVLL